MALNPVLHVRHGGIFSLGEVLMGLSGNSWRSVEQNTEEVLRSMSATERKIIADSDKHEEFKAMFGAKQKENSL